MIKQKLMREKLLKTALRQSTPLMVRCQKGDMFNDSDQSQRDSGFLRFRYFQHLVESCNSFERLSREG